MSFTLFINYATRATYISLILIHLTKTQSRATLWPIFGLINLSDSQNGDQNVSRVCARSDVRLLIAWLLCGLCCPQHALLCIQASFQVTKLPICLVPNGSSKSLTAAAADGGTTTAQLSSARLVFAFLARIDWKIVNIWHAILCILKDKSEKSTTPPGRAHREWQPERPRLKWTMMMMKRGKSP